MLTLTENQRNELKTQFSENLKQLYSFALFLCRDSIRAEELVAETAMKACEKFYTLKDKSKFKQWAFRILNNTFISSIRSRKNYMMVELKDNDALAEDENTYSSHIVGIWEGNPEKDFINKLLDNDIKESISRLPDEFRITIILCDVENFSYKEISQVLKIPVGTVRSRLSRGRLLLQKELRNHALELGIISESEEQELCDCGEPITNKGKKRVKI